MIDTLKYTLKIWLTTVFAASLALSCVVGYLMPESIVNACVLITGFGVVFSFITWALFLTGVYNILKLNLAINEHKILIQGLGLFLLGLTASAFAAAFDSFSALLEPLFWLVATPYIVCLAASIHFYNVPQLYLYHQENSTT